MLLRPCTLVTVLGAAGGMRRRRACRRLGPRQVRQVDCRVRAGGVSGWWRERPGEGAAVGASEQALGSASKLKADPQREADLQTGVRWATVAILATFRGRRLPAAAPLASTTADPSSAIATAA